VGIDGNGKEPEYLGFLLLQHLLREPNTLFPNFVMLSSQAFFPSSMISSVSNIPFCTASQVGLLSMFNGVNSLPCPESDVLKVWEYTLVLSPRKKIAVGTKILVPSSLPGDDDLLSWEFISESNGCILEIISKSDTGSDFRIQLKALGYMSPPNVDEDDALPFEAGISYVHRFPLEFSLMVIDGTTPFGAVILGAVMADPAPVDDDQSSSVSAFLATTVISKAASDFSGSKSENFNIGMQFRCRSSEKIVFFRKCFGR
jgi:hypothetical protein